ncbi:Uncharacterised protein [Klebsiella pneumoniae]|uniref:Uncharacterized protein n=1 Tax=Klebsiella pneumoniae TaxID=573 RepID=A0A2X3GU82_KLEPN|nr:Uncharacterised protein [Klebsiella pneumoniae]
MRAFPYDKSDRHDPNVYSGKDAALEDSIARFQQKLLDLGFDIEEASWLNRCRTCGPFTFAIKRARCALPMVKAPPKRQPWPPALGEYFERLSTNYFFADFWLGDTIANGPFVHYPERKVVPAD